MGQVVYRGNVLSKSFPFLSENMGNTIIVGQIDQYYNSKAEQSTVQDTDADLSKGIPQLYYCHNVMPHDQGLQSIGYTQVITPLQNVSDFIYVFLLRDSADNKAYLGVRADGTFWINTGSTWVQKGSYTAGAGVTTAYVSGVTYIYIANYGCIKYDFGTAAFVAVTLTGLTAANVVGICPSYGYLIAWTSSTVVWSSTIDPTDFTPSLVTGAGGGGVESARGKINFCAPHTLGFIVYTSDNAVAALYQANSRYPFSYKEIVNSGGVASMDLVAYDANTQGQYVYSTGGIQLVSTSQTQTQFPEITDFISGRKFEDFDDGTQTFTRTILSAGMKKKLTLVSERYMVMSYGINELTHAIVYDMVLKRYGKLKITHVEAFEYQLPNAGIVEIPRQSLAFLQKNGAVQIVDFSIDSPNANGTAILGRYQYVRSRLLQLDTVEFARVIDTNQFTLTIFSLLPNLSTVSSSPTLIASGDGRRYYGSRAEGVNHSLVFQGGWLLNDILLTFNIGGKR